MRIGLCCGYWSQNIGNAFFQIGGQYLVRTALSNEPHEVIPVLDGPGNWTLAKKGRGEPRNALGPEFFVDGIDTLVIQGPSLSTRIRPMWTGTFELMRREGKGVALIGVSFLTYSREEIAEVRSFIDDYSDRIAVANCRDERTASLLEGVGVRVQVGLDSAFFISLAFQPATLKFEKPTVAACFDSSPEPAFAVEAGAGHGIDVRGVSVSVETRRMIGGWMAERSQAAQWLATWADRRRPVTDPEAVRVIRLDHRTNPPVHGRTFARPSTLASDEPFSYLTVYRNADLVVSDRVHACVAGISYLTPVLFCGRTPRSGLLQRVGHVGSGVFYPDPMVLDQVRADQTAQVREVLLGL